MIALGKKVKDKIMGVTGIATSRIVYLNGLSRISVQPPLNKDRSIPSEVWFDEDQLEIVGVGVKIKPKDTGGPQSTKVPKGFR